MSTELEIETHPFEPFLPTNAKLLMLGSFPPPKTRWRMNFYYPNYQNDMWRIFGLVFFENKDYFLDVANKNFKLELLRDFLMHKGIAIFDSAHRAIRLKGNASDKFLQVEEAINIEALLARIPHCHSVMTTGDKATDTLMLALPQDTEKPQIGVSSSTYFADRALTLYRMPSSSRAYPLAVEKKAVFYRTMFEDAGLL
ncbi:DNA glycosylase [Acinetobacter harbinensis]|uniref:uracil-DNA glycosylase family protein n=1 Tax=Acinetobacter harbinensis TaxID=1353941 RepID=UPI00057E2B74|nr:uracil-DNA glycosylase family protein [Acinetobacter harbinensis]KWQ05122.1 DNA glycosylase [Acinetobacter harbinensis]